MIQFKYIIPYIGGKQMQQQETLTRKNRVLVPQIIALIIVLITVAAFFLPYISSTGEYAKYLEYNANEKVIDTADMTVGDMKNLSMFDYAKVYFQAGEELWHNDYAGIFYTVFIGLIGFFALLTFISALGRKPILILIFTALMVFLFYELNWDFTDRGIMPYSDRLWGLSYYVYYPCSILLALSAVWMFVAKHKMKKEMKLVSTK
jgi:hypothetical protein